MQVKEYILHEKSVEKRGDNIYLRFCSNALRFTIRYQVSNVVNGYFPHVGITAREGLALLWREHIEAPEQNIPWKPIDLICRDTETEINMSHLIRRGQTYEIAVYGPILACLDKVSVSVKDDELFSVPDVKYERNILVLGGRKTFGIGVTSSSMMFSNIIRRNHEVRLKRIAVSDNNFLKDIYDQTADMEDISGYDTVICEIDAQGQDDRIVREYLESTLKLLAKAKHVVLWHAAKETVWKRKQEIKTLIDSVLQQYNSFSYLDLNCLFSPEYADMCTYSANFINDAANILIYQAIEKELETYLWNT